VDALPNIDFTMSMGLAPDLPGELQYQQKYAIMIRNSTKPQVITAADMSCLSDIVDIAAAATGGRAELSRKPIFVLYDEPTSPLVHIKEANEAAAYIMMSGWMGTNLVHDVGYLEFGLTYSYDLLVMCDEFIGQIRRMMEDLKLETLYETTFEECGRMESLRSISLIK
jgi:trimethylamine:corrinoid methyltransferase-like protein